MNRSLSLSLSLSLRLPLFPFFLFSFSLFLSLSFSHTHTLSLSLALFCSCAHSLSLFLPPPPLPRHISAFPFPSHSLGLLHNFFLCLRTAYGLTHIRALVCVEKEEEKQKERSNYRKYMYEPTDLWHWRVFEVWTFHWTNLLHKIKSSFDSDILWCFSWGNSILWAHLIVTFANRAESGLLRKRYSLEDLVHSTFNPFLFTLLHHK